MPSLNDNPQLANRENRTIWIVRAKSTNNYPNTEPTNFRDDSISPIGFRRRPMASGEAGQKDANSTNYFHLGPSASKIDEPAARSNIIQSFSPRKIIEDNIFINRGGSRDSTKTDPGSSALLVFRRQVFFPSTTCHSFLAFFRISLSLSLSLSLGSRDESRFDPSKTRFSIKSGTKCFPFPFLTICLWDNCHNFLFVVCLFPIFHSFFYLTINTLIAECKSNRLGLGLG